MGVAAVPLDVAADGVGERRAHGLPGQVLFEGAGQIIDLRACRVTKGQ